MEIKDIKPNTGNIDLVLNIVEKEKPRSFEKFGKQGRVCNALVRDETGEIKMTLWNDDIDKVEVGDKVHLQNGWCSEFKGEKQISTGKFGKVEVIEKAAGMDKPKEVLTNDPELLGQASAGEWTDEENSDEETTPIDEEEFVE